MKGDIDQLEEIKDKFFWWKIIEQYKLSINYIKSKLIENIEIMQFLVKMGNIST